MLTLLYVTGLFSLTVVPTAIGTFLLVDMAAISDIPHPPVGTRPQRRTTVTAHRPQLIAPPGLATTGIDPLQPRGATDTLHDEITNHCTMQANEVTRTVVGEVCCSQAIVDTQAMIPSRPSGHGRPTDRPIPVVVDLCLYRVVTDRCRGQVLPFGVRQTIKDYAWVSFDNETLRAAVWLWCSDRATAYDRYGDINDWDVSRVTNMKRLFRHTKFNDRIDRWDVRNVTSMEDMFDNATHFNQPLDTWNIGHVLSLQSMFSCATSFNQPLNMWDVNHVADMRSAFCCATAFNQPLSNWNVSRLTSLYSTFCGALSFNQPLSTWDVHRVIDMQNTFNEALSFNKPLNMWEVSHVTAMSNMFNGTVAFNQPLDTWDVSHVTDMQYMFKEAVSFNQSLATWNVSNVTNMRYMFGFAEAFNQPLDSWDVSNVSNMSYMFYGATSLNQPFDTWRVSPGTYAKGIFELAGCHPSLRVAT